MATACETVVLEGGSRAAAAGGFRVAISLGRVDGYGVTGGGFSSCFCRRGRRWGAAAVRRQRCTENRRRGGPAPVAIQQKMAGYGYVTWISTCAALYSRARWGPRCCAVHWSTGSDDKRRGWMQYWLFNDRL